MGDAVVVEVLQVVAGHALDIVHFGFRAHARAKVHPADAEAGVAAAVGEAQLQVGAFVQHAPEDEGGDGDGGVQGKTDEVGQVVATGPVGSGRIVGVEKDKGPQSLRCLEKGQELLFVPVVPFHVGIEFHPGQAQFSHAPLQFLHCCRSVLHWHGTQADEPVWAGACEFGNSVVKLLGRSQSLVRVQVIIGEIGRHRKDVNINSLLVHEGSPLGGIELPFLVNRAGHPIHGVDVADAIPEKKAGSVPVAVPLVAFPETVGDDVAVDIYYFHTTAPFTKGYSIPFALPMGKPNVPWQCAY